MSDPDLRPGATDLMIVADVGRANGPRLRAWKLELQGFDDVVLLRMNGPQLAERLRLARPEMKVMFMSGYTDESIALHGILDSAAEYLQKPITPAMLTKRVREVLDTRPRSNGGLPDGDGR